MLWSFIAVCFSAWLYVDASYRGPAWRRWVFKPVTLILLLLLAWQAPMFNAISYLVLARTLRLAGRRCADPAAAAAGDVRRGGVLSLASALHHLVCQPADAIFLLAAAAGAADPRRAAAGDYLDASGRDADAGVYLYRDDAGDGLAGTGELWFARPTDTALSGFAGAAFLLLGNAVWLISHYRRRFRADNAISSAFYFAGHFLIVRALYL